MGWIKDLFKKEVTILVVEGAPKPELDKFRSALELKGVGNNIILINKKVDIIKL